MAASPVRTIPPVRIDVTSERGPYPVLVGPGLTRDAARTLAAGEAHTAISGLGVPIDLDATRALHAGNADRFRALITDWPADISAYSLRLSADAFGA